MSRRKPPGPARPDSVTSGRPAVRQAAQRGRQTADLPPSHPSAPDPAMLIPLAGLALVVASKPEGDAYTGAEALADVERVGTARDWPDEQIVTLLQELPQLEGYDNDEEPSEGWILASSVVLEGLKLEGAAELAAAWRQRIGRPTLTRRQLLEEYAQATTEDAADVAEDIADTAGKVGRAGKAATDKGAELLESSPLATGLFALGVFVGIGWGVNKLRGGA